MAFSISVKSNNAPATGTVSVQTTAVPKAVTTSTTDSTADKTPTRGFHIEKKTTAQTNAENWQRLTAQQQTAQKADAEAKHTASVAAQSAAHKPTAAPQAAVQQKTTTAQTGRDKNTDSDFSMGKLLAGGIRKGVANAGTAISSTLSWLESALFAPVEAVTGYNDLQELHGLFYNWNEQNKKERNAVNEKFAANTAAGGTAAKVAEDVIAGTTAAAPQAIAAFMSAGTSALGQVGLEATAVAAQQSPTLLNTLRGAIAGMANNPRYWTSFLQTAGNSYEEAKADGASDAKASLYALSNGLFNAAIEVGGGLETLPGELQGGKATFRSWLNTMREEGKEEVWQGIVERGLQNLTYGKNNPVASLTDESAVLNPITSAKEYGMGSAIGGILGGGQMALSGAVSSARGLKGPNDFNPDAEAEDAPLPRGLSDALTEQRTEGNLTPAANEGAETQKIAPGGTAISAGRVTTIRNPYQGKTPVQTQTSGNTVLTPDSAFARAEALISEAQELDAAGAGSFKTRLTRLYQKVFQRASDVEVAGMTYDKKPYSVEIGNKVPGKIISAPGFSAEKLALLDILPQVVRDAQYVGSGEYAPEGKKARPVERYDYFETPVKINGTDYIAKFDVEVLPDRNNYRTHQIVNVDLTTPGGSLVGPLPTAAPSGSSPLSDATIAQESNVVKSSGPRRLPGPIAATETDAAANAEGPLRFPGPITAAKSEAAATAEGEQPAPSVRETIPAKAQNYLQRAERELMSKVGNALSVPRLAQRSYLQSIVQTMSEEYLQNGRISQETVNSLFEQAYEQGIVTDAEFYDRYKGLKDLLRTTSVSISEEDAADIADFNDFRKSAFGTLRIARGGTPVDIVYEEMREQAPELFPANITHPADQLQRLYEVGRSIQKVETDLNGYYGEQAEDFKRWARNDFEAAVNDSVAELNRVKRYADERASKAEQPAITESTVKNAFENVRRARRTAEKAKAKNLLTEYDDAQVGRLLKGEITLEDLDAGKANVKGIREVFEAQREYDRLAETIRDYNKQRKANLLNEADRLLSTANDWKDKIAGILYSRETMERNVRDIVPDRRIADQIVDKYFTPVHESQAASTRFKDEYRNRVRRLDLSRQVDKGNAVSEAHAVQLLGEAEDNIRVLNESRRSGELRDGKTADEWRAVVRELWEQSPNLDRAKVENAVKEFRGIYDELFERMNEVRVRNGYEPVGYRQGYFPHFQPGETEGVIASFAKALGIDTDVQTLPTTINGLTHTFRPGITWFGSAQERLGFNTAYDAVEGFDRYIEGVSDVIHQTDNIQRLRALAQQIRYRTGDEGMRKQMDAIRADNTLDEDTKNDKLEQLKESGRYTLGNFVVELEEYTNLLANKKSRADRNMEQAIGRRMYNIVKGLESRVAANMVAVNPGSWLTNFIPLTQGWATLDTGTLLKGMGQTLKAYKSDDGMVARSSFLTNRRGSDPIVKTWAQEMSSRLSSPMDYIDSFTADSLVRARYMQNIRQGLSEDAAIKEADAWAAGIMADRSKGATPTLFNRSNPITKLFTQFQLEVNNEFSNLYKDVPDELKKKGLSALAAGLLKYFVGAFLYNEIYEYVVGRRAAFDPIGILNDTAGDLAGYELPNLIEGAQGITNGEGLDVFRTDKAGAYNTVANLAGNVAEELPFVGGLLGGGRLPISSALPDMENLAKAAFNDQWSDKKRVTTAAKELGAPVTYLALPFGGGQLKKIYQGLSAVLKGGSYSVDSQGRDILQYPVFNDTSGEIAGGVARSLLFGKSSLPAARDWVESGFDSFSAKETAVYQGMNDAGVSDRDAYSLLRELGSVQKTDNESANEIKRRILRESSISGEGKSVAYYGLLATEKERELMDDLAGNSEMGTATEMLMRFKDIGDLTGSDAAKAKYQTILNSGLTELGKRIVYRAMVSEDHEDELDKLSTQGVGIDGWLRYQAGTAGLTADKDASGKTISGSKKAKQMAVIDAMALTNEQKDALYLAAGLTASTIDDAPWRGGVPRTLPGPVASSGSFLIRQRVGASARPLPGR